MIIISFMVCIYYNVIIAYSLHFIFNTFTLGDLPWQGCDNPWNSQWCKEQGTNSTINPALVPPYKIDCEGKAWDENGTDIFTVTVDGTLTNITGSCHSFETPAQEYFSKRVLNISDGIGEIGGIQWELLGCLIFAWIIVFICLFKGVKWSGKVVYFTATFPYVVLVTLLIVGVQQEGAGVGIEFYLKPNTTKLGEIRVWKDAAVQIFYSLGAAWGVILSYSSLNKFNNNTYRDALSICTVNCMTSILAGFVVFSVLGSLAHQTGQSIKDVVDEGAGLAFVAYPAAVANLPYAPIWAFLFFFMLLNLGLDSQFGMLEAVVAGLLDEVKILRDNKVKFLAGICFVQFLLAIPMITQSGMYWVTLVDWYCSGLSLMVAAACEVACIAWIYGTDRFMYDIRCMIGYVPKFAVFWQFMWTVTTPIVILGLISCYFIFFSPATYNGVEFPAWAQVVGWMSSMLSVLCIPGFAIYQILKNPIAKGSLKERLSLLSKPEKTWNKRCPPELRKEFSTKWSFFHSICPGGSSSPAEYTKGKTCDSRSDSEVSDPPPYNCSSKV